MNTDPLAEALARAYYEPLGWDMDDLDPDDLRDCLRAMEPVADAARAHAAAHDAQVRADERQKVEAEVRELRAERDEWRDVSVGPAYATLLREQAQTAEAELARIRAILADEGTVETVAEELSAHDDLPGWTCDDDDRLVYECLCGDRSLALDQDYIRPDDAETAGAWHRAHVARAALDALAGLTGGDA